MYHMHITFQLTNNSEKLQYLQITEFWYMTTICVEHGTELSEEPAASVFRAKEASLFN